MDRWGAVRTAWLDRSRAWPAVALMGALGCRRPCFFYFGSAKRKTGDAKRVPGLNLYAFSYLTWRGQAVRFWRPYPESPPESMCSGPSGALINPHFARTSVRLPAGCRVDMWDMGREAWIKPAPSVRERDAERGRWIEDPVLPLTALHPANAF